MSAGGETCFFLADLFFLCFTKMTNSTKSIYLTVKVDVSAGTDIRDLVENLDYEFSNNGQTLETEITKAFDSSGSDIF